MTYSLSTAFCGFCDVITGLNPAIQVLRDVISKDAYLPEGFIPLACEFEVVSRQSKVGFVSQRLLTGGDGPIVLAGGPELFPGSLVHVPPQAGGFVLGSRQNL